MTKNLRIAYILRQSDEGIPTFDTKEETYAELPSYFIVGSCSSKFLHSMKVLTKQVRDRFHKSHIFLNWPKRGNYPAFC